MPTVHSFLTVWPFLSFMMIGLYLVHLRTRNAAIVDVGWAVGLPIAALWHIWRPGTGQAAWLLAGLTAVWGLRLAGYLFVTRVMTPHEDGRYVALREGWGTAAPWKFFIFFQAQAVLDLVLSIPAWLVARSGADIGPAAVLGTVIWSVAVTGEAIADRQLASFRREPRNRGRVCDHGLWKYSRHPNYFFEWLVWVGYACFAATAPDGWLAWSAPALMLYFLFKITGIPATEAQALKTKGEAYRRYQRSTSVFVPWPPKRPVP
jgi:steroid 5-alpha reductase family enzyme